MSLLRGYLKVKIKKEEVKEFEALVVPYVAVVKDSEPMALQFQAFINDTSSEVVWLESYQDKLGFDNHLSNPLLDEWKRKMMPKQERMMDMYFMSPPTEAVLMGLAEFGLKPTVLKPWPGTNKLTEASQGNENIQIFATVDLHDLDAYRKISARVEEAALVQPGVLFHQSYQINDSRVGVLEEYQDSDALLKWAEVFEHVSGDFSSLVKSLTCEVFGDPSLPCRDMLDGWGAEYYRKIAGFQRF